MYCLYIYIISSGCFQSAASLQPHCNMASDNRSRKHGAASAPLHGSFQPSNFTHGAFGTQQSCRVGHDLTVWRMHCAHFGHPRPSYKPRNTAPLTSQRASAKHGAALPPPMLRSTCALTRRSLQGCLWRNHVLVTSISAAQASTPMHSPAPSTHAPSTPTHLSLPSIFPPQPRPHSIFPLQPRPQPRPPPHPSSVPVNARFVSLFRGTSD